MPTCSAARGTHSPLTPCTSLHPSQAGTTAKFLAVLDAHGLTHGLLVGAGPYGADNRCMLAGIAASGRAVEGRRPGLDHDATDRELVALVIAASSVRFNLFRG